MGKIIVVVGSSGVGKTTLVRLLCQRLDFSPGLESHSGRPFQTLFSTDQRYALPNQIDYLLFRMEQELAIRSSPRNGILDGGLEMDFYGFTRLFHARSWLSDGEFDLCRQLYVKARTLLPHPEVILHLTATPGVIAKRLKHRHRINIVNSQDTELLDFFLQEWLSGLGNGKLIHLEVSDADLSYSQVLPALVEQIGHIL